MPRSEWWGGPCAERCRTIAMVSASNAISLCSVSRIDERDIVANWLTRAPPAIAIIVASL
jgi:hypothetical protein